MISNSKPLPAAQTSMPLGGGVCVAIVNDQHPPLEMSTRYYPSRTPTLMVRVLRRTLV